MILLKGAGVSPGCALGPVFLPRAAKGTSGRPVGFEEAREKASEYYASLGRKAGDGIQPGL